MLRVLSTFFRPIRNTLCTPDIQKVYHINKSYVKVNVGNVALYRKCKKISVDMSKIYCLIWVKFWCKGTAHNIIEHFLNFAKFGARQAVNETKFTLVNRVIKDTSVKIFVPPLGIHHLHSRNTKIRRFRFFGVLTVHYQSLYP